MDLVKEEIKKEGKIRGNYLYHKCSYSRFTVWCCRIRL